MQSKFYKLFNLRLKYNSVLTGQARKNALQDLEFKQNKYQSLMPGFISYKKYIEPFKYKEQPEFYTFKQQNIRNIRSRIQIKVRRFQREMENYNFGYNQQLPISEIKNNYSFNLMMYYQDRLPKNLLILVLDNIYKNGLLRSSFLMNKRKQEQEEAVLKDYFNDVKLSNFLKYSQPYLSDSDSE